MEVEDREEAPGVGASRKRLQSVTLDVHEVRESQATGDPQGQG